MQPSPGGVTRTPRCQHGPSGLLQHFFLAWWLCALRWDARGGPLFMSRRWPLAEPATQLRTFSTPPPGPRLSPHAAVAIQSSPPASPFHWALIFFRGLLHFCDSRPSVSLESRAFPAAAPCSHLLGDLLGEPLRSLRLYQAHRRSPTPSRHLVGTSCLAWPPRDELPTSTLPGLVNLFLSSTPSLHLRTVAGALAK